MNKQTLKTAIDEANRFLKRARLLHELSKNDKYLMWNPKEQGSVKRASMDLTRALAELRRHS